MAVSTANLSAEPRSFSIGPLKLQIKTLTAASGDTSATVTFDNLQSVVAVVCDAVTQTSAATFSTNQATLTFADPGVAGAAGVIIGIGR